MTNIARKLELKIFPYLGDLAVDVIEIRYNYPKKGGKICKLAKIQLSFDARCLRC